ncbi:hypothetical protein G7046_g2344 [Stylonectria norvegica]|nr:hypothetical protein G7046_g2344 [Stylonectria norvegica]
MPRPTTSIPDYLPPLHVYRHLLRECSYLPPAWRNIVTTSIRNRYQRHRKYDDREKTHRISAVSALRRLRAANSGHKGAMRKLVENGFGRSGERRRQLLSPFVQATSPSDSDSLEALLDGETGSVTLKTKNKKEAVPTDPKAKRLATGDDEDSPITSISSRPPSNSFYQNWDAEKLTKFLNSQKKAMTENKHVWISREIKLIDPRKDIPKTNIWGKPPSENVVRSKTATFWRLNANKMMPPVSKGEWDLLRRLSEGAQSLDDYKIPERRPAATPLAQRNDSPSSSWNWTRHANAPAAWAERSNTFEAAFRTGQETTGPYQALRKIREVSPRWYRRMYSRTWQMTPMVEQDARTLKHSFSWGAAKSPICAPSKAQLEIFEGVDSHGAVPKPKSTNTKSRGDPRSNSKAENQQQT